MAVCGWYDSRPDDSATSCARMRQSSYQTQNPVSAQADDGVFSLWAVEACKHGAIVQINVRSAVPGVELEFLTLSSPIMHEYTLVIMGIRECSRLGNTIPLLCFRKCFLQGLCRHVHPGNLAHVMSMRGRSHIHAHVRSSPLAHDVRV